MRNPFKILRVYMQNRDRWEDICQRCGRCCFERAYGSDGQLTVNYAAPCEFLDLDTHECRVYETRFALCNRCKKLTLRGALFNKLLPAECAYRQLFAESDKG